MNSGDPLAPGATELRTLVRLSVPCSSCGRNSAHAVLRVESGALECEYCGAELNLRSKCSLAKKALHRIGLGRLKARLLR